MDKSGNTPKVGSSIDDYILRTYKRIAAEEVMDAFEDIPLGNPLPQNIKTIVNQLNEAETLEECVQAWHTSNPTYDLYNKRPNTLSGKSFSLT